MEDGNSNEFGTLSSRLATKSKRKICGNRRCGRDDPRIQLTNFMDTQLLLCEKCRNSVNSKFFCPKCREIGKIDAPKDKQWIGCENKACLQWTHTQCEKQDVIRKAKKEGGKYFCSSCRASAGGVAESSKRNSLKAATREEIRKIFGSKKKLQVMNVQYTHSENYMNINKLLQAANLPQLTLTDSELSDALKAFIAEKRPLKISIDFGEKKESSAADDKSQNGDKKFPARSKRIKIA